LSESYLNDKIAGRQCVELSHVRLVSSLIPKRIMNADFEYPIMDGDAKHVQLQDYDYEFSEDEITLCKVTMLGVVMQWQPRVEDIKEVCFKASQDYSIANAIYDNCTTHDRYSYSLLNIWASQLRAAGFWDNEKQVS
jgi:hypothetical protein